METWTLCIFPRPNMFLSSESPGRFCPTTTADSQRATPRVNRYRFGITESLASSGIEIRGILPRLQPGVALETDSHRTIRLDNNRRQYQNVRKTEDLFKCAVNELCPWSRLHLSLSF